MATQLLYATAHSSGNVTTPANALGAPDDTFTTDTLNASWTSRFAMGDPSTVTPAGTQTVSVRVRKNGSGGGTPTITAVNLFDGSTSVRNLLGATADVTSDTGMDVEVTFTASEVANPNNVEIQLVTAGAGAGGSRRCVQLDAITWTADDNAAVAGTTLKTWTGSAWTPGELKRWTGSAWVGARLKRWTGSEWADQP
jgi:hypothetical protein